jgi:hypothetical protein
VDVFTIHENTENTAQPPLEPVASHPLHSSAAQKTPRSRVHASLYGRTLTLLECFSDDGRSTLRSYQFPDVDNWVCYTPAPRLSIDLRGGSGMTALNETNVMICGLVKASQPAAHFLTIWDVIQGVCCRMDAIEAIDRAREPLRE